MSASGRRTATLCLWMLLPALAASHAVGLFAQSLPAVRDLTIDARASSVEVTVTATTDVQYTYFRLDGPRLVLDVHDADNQLGFSRRSVGAGGVSQVRAARFSDETRDVTRVVFDLEEGTGYEVARIAPGVIRVRFDAPAAAEERPLAQDLPPTRKLPAEPDLPPAPSAPLEATEPPPGPDVPAAPTIRTEVPSPLAPVQVASLVPTVPPLPVGLGESPEVEVESALTGTLAPERPAAPPAEGPAEAAQSVQASPLEGVTLQVPSTSSEIGSPAPRDPGPFLEPAPGELEGTTGPEPLLSPQTVSPVPTPQYTGEIYSFDFRDLDLQDFFRTISDISGLNVILDPNIPDQPLTMVLRDVPWDQALDIVLRSYNLAWELNGNVLRIAQQTTLQAEEERRRQFRQAQEENGPLVTNTYVLSYAQAATASPLVEDLLTSRGTVVPVPEKNALLVTDIETRFEAISNLIGFLDTPAEQVEIVARLLQANKTFRLDIGNQLGVIFGNNSANVLTGVPSLPSPFIRNPPPSVTAGGVDALPLIADFGLAAPTAGLSYLLGVGGDVLLDEIIEVAESRGTARLLSRPNVVVQNNEAAVIEQGTEIPIQTNVNNTISVQYQQFALRLEVTPQITEEGTILLNAVIENSTPDFSQQVNGIPSVATQRAQTRVLIGDGETAYVGGILVDSDTVSVNQVPGLGNIPILGYLFKSTSTVKGTSELLFFVTARIKPAEPIDFLTDSASVFSPDPDTLFADEPPIGILSQDAEVSGEGVD